MKIINVKNSLPWKTSNGLMHLKDIDTVVIHHDAVTRPVFYNSIKRLIKEANGHIAKGWNHISYHYSIDNVGDIYQCLVENEVAFHCGNFDINNRSIAIKLDGNFETQNPTSKQIKALQELIKYLTTQRPDLPKVLKKSIKMHKQIKATSCPGRNLYAVVERLQR